MTRAQNFEFLIASGLLLLAGCGGEQPQQTMLRPGGPMASHIEGLWWFIFVIAVVVFVIVVAILATAAARRRVHEQFPPEIHPDPDAEQRYARVVMVATGVSLVILFVVLAKSVATGKYMNIATKNPVTVEVIGHQWWWEVRYPNPDASMIVTTANEIHLPTGTPVVVLTSSQDVIHSLWAPSIQGKRDLIPGYQNTIWMQVDQEGTYRGQCAEFCGHQHAHMAFYVVAEKPEKFAAWLDGQRKSPPPPSDPVLVHGQEVFTGSTCIMCHQIRGTIAGSHFGPDLTHVGSRLSLGAGTLPNTPGAMGGWISDPQSIKPGVRMPPNALPAQDLQAVVAYLGSLK